MNLKKVSSLALSSLTATKWEWKMCVQVLARGWRGAAIQKLTAWMNQPTPNYFNTSMRVWVFVFTASLYSILFSLDCCYCSCHAGAIVVQIVAFSLLHFRLRVPEQYGEWVCVHNFAQFYFRHFHLTHTPIIAEAHRGASTYVRKKMCVCLFAKIDWTNFFSSLSLFAVVASSSSFVSWVHCAMYVLNK